MRRTALLTMGVCALLALTGVANAVEWRNPAAEWRRPATASLPAPAVAPEDVAPEVVGRVEAVASGVLDRVGGNRTLTVRHPGADYVKVHFSRLAMLPGDRVVVADPTGQELHRYSESDLREAGDWAMSVFGDTAVVTMESAQPDPLGLRSRLAGVTVDKFARGLTAQERKQPATGREESVCGRSDEKADAACYKSSDPVAYAHAKPVARLLIDSVELCTAWRVGPNNRMFTNHHCFAQSYEARHTEVWFNYECARCGGFETLRPTKVMGERVLATDSVLDYTLFTVQNFDALSKFGYLTIDPRRPNRGDELYIPQHPRGDPTVIAMEDSGERSGNCAVANPQYDGYDRDTDVSYYCDTEGGSSGSPVISRQTNQVIALHHFGGCPNSGVRIDLIYSQLASLL